FARGRRALLEQDLANLPGAAREAVRNLFSEFETAIRVAEDAVRVREPLSPWEVARAMGYPVPDGPEVLPSRIARPPQSARCGCSASLLARATVLIRLALFLPRSLLSFRGAAGTPTTSRPGGRRKGTR